MMVMDGGVIIGAALMPLLLLVLAAGGVLLAVRLKLLRKLALGVGLAASFLLVLLLVLIVGRGVLEQITDRDYWGPPPLRTLTPGPKHEPAFGRLASVGDVDGDGCADLLVDAESGSQEATPRIGIVFSGLDGRVLLQLRATRSVPSPGITSLSSAGDVDGDGRPDLVLGIPNNWPGGGATSGEVQVFSGRDGSMIRTWMGLANREYFGGSVTGAGDVDGDGFGDVLIGSPGPLGGPSQPGPVRLYSGRNGSLLWTLEGEPSERGFGSALCALGDVDGDGRSDFAVGAVGIDEPGAVQAFSFSKRSALWKVTGSAPESDVGNLLQLVGDWDGDGIADLLIGDTEPSLIVSARSGTRLRTFEGSSVLALLTDWDGDGMPELLRHVWSFENEFYDHTIYTRLEVLGSRNNAVLADLGFPFPLFSAAGCAAGCGDDSGAFATNVRGKVLVFSKSCFP